MSRGFLLIDAQNIAHASNSTAPLKVGDQPTQAIYGFLRAIRPMIAAYPTLTPIVLWDGASWRKMAYPEYKANRDKAATTPAEVKAAELKAQLKPQIPHIKAALRMLAVRQMFALNYEADDLAGMLVRRYAPQRKVCILISGDKDWVQLVGPTVAWIDPIRDVRITPKTIEQKLGYRKKDTTFVGVPSARAWLEVKALMGDTGDHIPGVGGIGKNGAIDFIRTYGSVTAFFNGTVDGSIDVSKLPKKFKDLAESNEKQELFHRNMKLMDLGVDGPTPVNLSIDAGSADSGAFEDFCRHWMFNSILSDFGLWTKTFFPPPWDVAA